MISIADVLREAGDLVGAVRFRRGGHAGDARLARPPFSGEFGVTPEVLVQVAPPAR